MTVTVTGEDRSSSACVAGTEPNPSNSAFVGRYRTASGQHSIHDGYCLTSLIIRHPTQAVECDHKLDHRLSNDEGTTKLSGSHPTQVQDRLVVLVHWYATHQSEQLTELASWYGIDHGECVPQVGGWYNIHGREQSIAVMVVFDQGYRGHPVLFYTDQNNPVVPGDKEVPNPNQRKQSTTRTCNNEQRESAQRSTRTG